MDFTSHTLEMHQLKNLEFKRKTFDQHGSVDLKFQHSEA